MKMKEELSPETTADAKEASSAVDAIVMQRCLTCGNEPYSDKCPVLIIWDYDLGWIVEAVEDGEYEVQNLPYPLYTKNEEPDFELAMKIAKEKGVRVRYYHKWDKVA